MVRDDGREQAAKQLAEGRAGGSPDAGIDQPRLLRRLLRTARPEAVPRLRARLLISEAYVEATRRGRVDDFCSDRARALLSMWSNLATDPGTFEVTRHASDVLERVRACLSGDVAQGAAPCECGAPKPRGRRYCDRCRDRHRRESNRERSRRRRGKGDGTSPVEENETRLSCGFPGTVSGDPLRRGQTPVSGGLKW